MEGYWFAYITIGLVGLVQVPIAIDLLRFMFPKWKVTRIVSRAVHVFLFTVMGTIYIIGLSYHLFVFLPLLVGQDSLYTLKGLVHIVFALWVWINIVGNYYYAVWVHPGVDKDYSPPSREPVLCCVAEDGTVNPVKETDSNANRRLVYCDPSHIQCNKPKNGIEWSPSRTHYCKICKCAIPYLDHHCPFTGNCAGLKNYSNFLICLVYGTVGLFYAAVVTLPYFFECNVKNILWFFGLVSSRETYPICEQLGAHSHIFLPVFAGFFMSLHMVLLQLTLLISDLSTYNILTNWTKYPMMRFMSDRIKARKYRDKDSRLNILMNKRFVAYILPIRQ